MRGESDPPADGKLPLRSLPLPQREIALLIILCVLCIVTFAATRRMASWSHGRRTEAAAEWFARGEALTQAGHLDAGIAALREAMAEERQNPIYVLGLARRLTEAERHDEATQLLLQLRRGQPDDVEVNYGLARLAALNGDEAEAIRYYNYAMYGLVRIGVDYNRREIRTELINFLLDEGAHQEARIELEALGRELPDEPEANLQAAQLADRAGDTRRALEFYGRTAALDPTHADAAAGVGNAAFVLRDFATASREMARAISLGADAPRLATRLEVSQLVQNSDPLAPRVASAVRARRLRAGLVNAASGYDACVAESDADQESPDATQVELRALTRGRQSSLQDPDVLARGVTLIGEVTAAIQARCPTRLTPLDQAWQLIAELHPGGDR